LYHGSEISGHLKEEFGYNKQKNCENCATLERPKSSIIASNWFNGFFGIGRRVDKNANSSEVSKELLSNVVVEEAE
jgi:hypothetical protein